MKTNYPPAFPVTETVFDDKSFQPENLGMTIRDWFAGQALTGCIHIIDTSQIPKLCYEIADAMLKQREVSHE